MEPKVRVVLRQHVAVFERSHRDTTKVFGQKLLLRSIPLLLPLLHTTAL